MGCVFATSAGEDTLDGVRAVEFQGLPPAIQPKQRILHLAPEMSEDRRRRGRLPCRNKVQHVRMPR